jgi:signal transduction histidine kinase
MDLFRKVVLPRLTDDVELQAGVLNEYRRIWVRTIVLTLAVALTPLAVMTLVNFYLFTRGLRSDLRHQISEDLSNISGSVEAVIEERVSALQFLASQNDLAEMTGTELIQAYEALRSSFGGFIDLGIIDPQGKQIAYTGPYSLEGDNYYEEAWFLEARTHDVSVSEVFMGHRQLPHFVVVVRSGEYLLRATMDMALLNQEIHIPVTGSRDDVFLVSEEGVLQTDSRHYGTILTSSSLIVPPYSPDFQILEHIDDIGSRHFLGCSYINRTPFVLLVVRSFDGTFREWLNNSAEILVFLFASFFMIVGVVFWSSTATVRHIQAADHERAQILRRIEHTSKMATIGRLAASVAHEVNNPLAVINEKAGMLIDLISSEDDFPYRDKSLSNLDSIVRMVERCGVITHRLLGFTQRLQSSKQRIDLRALGTDVLGFLEKQALHREIELVFDVADDVPNVLSDPGQLEEVLLNLLNNAFAAVEDGGRVEVQVRRGGPSTVSITVKDDGCGIDPDALEHIFEPFYSTKGDFGTGLGLCITEDLVEKLGGRIEAESEVGVGSSFVVHLPLDTDTPID